MDGAALVLMDDGALSHLNALRAGWLLTLRIGLFQNDWHPRRRDTIAHVVPATFSGYGGPHFVYGWQPAALFGDLAVSQAGPNLWTHDGGPVGCWVLGYYVIDPAGVLQWGERFPGDPVPMDTAGAIYRVVPRYAVGSRFSE